MIKTKKKTDIKTKSKVVKKKTLSKPKKKVVTKKATKKQTPSKKIINKPTPKLDISNFNPPYYNGNRTTYWQTKERSGVYIIKENNKIVYIGRSGSNLYKTLYRHFETWTHRTQEVVSYKHLLKRNKYTVSVILTTPKEANSLEKALILKHRPRDCEQKYEIYINNKDVEKAYLNYKKQIPMRREKRSSEFVINDKVETYNDFVIDLENEFNVFDDPF